MIGGIVKETVVLPNKVWVNCVDKNERRHDQCAVYCERNEKSEAIKPGDSFWWQGGYCMWTPFRENLHGARTSFSDVSLKSGIDYDIRIPKIGFSGVSKP